MEYERYGTWQPKLLKVYPLSINGGLSSKCNTSVNGFMSIPLRRGGSFVTLNSINSISFLMPKPQVPLSTLLCVQSSGITSNSFNSSNEYLIICQSSKVEKSN